MEETNRKRYCQTLTDKWKNRNKRRKDDLKEKYWIKTKGFKAVIEEIKQRKPKTEKLKSYNNRIKQFTQNLIFQYNQLALYDEISGKEKS